MLKVEVLYVYKTVSILFTINKSITRGYNFNNILYE